MFTRIGRAERPVQPVVEGHRSPHRRQAAPHGHLQHRQAEQAGSGRRQGGGDGNAPPRQGRQTGNRPALKNQLRQTRLRRGPEPHRITVAEQEFPDALPSPVQPVGGAVIAKQPIRTDLLQQGVPLADGRMVEADLQSAVAAYAIEPAVQVDAAAGLAGQEDLQERLAGGGSSGDPQFQPFSAQHQRAPPKGPGPGRPLPG